MNYSETELQHNHTFLWSSLDITNFTNINGSYDNSFNLQNSNNHRLTLRYGIVSTVILIIAYCTVFFVGVLGNLAVFIVVKRTPRMRTLTNQFIANLSIADLLVNVICLPFTLAANLFPAWSLGAFFCKAVSYLQGVSVSASVNTLMAISIERCMAISCPLSPSMSSKQYKLAVSIIWLIALTINLPWIFVFTLEPMEKGSHLEVCVELWPSQQSENLFFILANLIFCYLGPLLVISICYILIWIKVKNRSIPGEHLRHASMINTIKKSRLKVTKMVLVVIITFALSWLPLYSIFCVVKFWDNIVDAEPGQSIIHVLLPIAQWLGASNSSINPILYAYMNRTFRSSFLNFFGKPCCSKQTQINLIHYRSDSGQNRRPIMAKTSSTTNNSPNIVVSLSRQDGKIDL